MRNSLRAKLSASYIFIALFLVALISFLTNFFLEDQFKHYIIQEQEQRNKNMLNLISQQYKGAESGWDINGIENIGISALEQGLIIKVRDNAGQTIWDATVHNNGLCTTMLAHMAENMSSHNPNFQGSYFENSYAVVRNSATLGTLDVGYYGPYYFTDNDLAFINTLNQMLLGVGIFALVFALFLGAFMAKRLSNPISQVITSARQITTGNFGSRVVPDSNTEEIVQLTDTINNLAETLEKQDNLRKRLSADVAHELRTPLATLQSHLEAMIDGIWKPDPDRLKSCHDEIMRINRMVGDLAQLARYESENLILKKTEFDLFDLAETLLKNFESDFSSQGVKLDLQGSKQKITADKDKISQVFVNLIANALKYTPAGGSVEITVKGTAGNAEISVKDTGIGISAEDLPNIFERFYRADKSRNRITGGSGIGLAIVKTIVEAHQGSIKVNSVLGQGSEFVVTLPNQSGTET